MPSEIREFAVTVATGTSKTAPQVTALVMPARTVSGIRVRVPPGPRGEVGFALGSGGTPVLPWGAGQWVVADDEAIDWPLSGQIDSGAWQLIAYNTGSFSHTLYVAFLVDPPQIVGAPALTFSQPLDLSGLSGLLN